MPDESGLSPAEKTSLATLLSMGAAALAQGHLDPVVIAGLLPATQQALDVAAETIRARFQRRTDETVAQASVKASLLPNELVTKLLGTPEGEELLVKALKVAQEATLEQEIAALASALASGALADDVKDIRAETLFCGTVAAIDTAHLAVLEQFVKARSNRPQSPMVPRGQLDRGQLNQMIPELASALDHVMATLEGQGLVIRVEQTTGIAAVPPNAWVISGYGEHFLARMREVGREALRRQDEG
jgi:hypothetical protein